MNSGVKKLWIVGERDRYLLDNSQVIFTIGSNPEANFRIANSYVVTCNHARFILRGKSWGIEPINGQVILDGDEIDRWEAIAINDSIQIGDLIFTVQEAVISSPSPLPPPDSGGSGSTSFGTTPPPPTATAPSPISKGKNSIIPSFFSQLKQRIPKPILFGVYGAIGCLLAAILLGELLLNLTKLPTPIQPSAQAVVLLIDCSGSMDNAKLQEVKSAAQSFVQRQNLSENRIAVVGFGSQVHPVVSLTENKTTLTEAIASLADGGGTRMERGIQAAAQELQSKAFKRNILLFTDGFPEDKFATTIVAQIVRTQGINIVAVATGDADINYLAEVTGNRKQVIYASSGQFEQAFQKAEQVISSLVENNLTGNYSPGYLMLRIGGWTGLLALGTSLALVIGQNVYWRRRFLTFKEGSISVVGGLTAGFVAGYAGQLLFLSATNIYILYAINAIRSITGWVIVGILLGAAMPLFARNLRFGNALVRGAVGGTIASISYLVASYMFGNTVVGMLVGVTILGLFIRLIVPRMRIGCFASLVAGIAAVSISNMFFVPTGIISIVEIISKIAGWTLLGTLLGGGISLFVPNLQLNRALFGGGIGGAIAAVSFLVAIGVVHDDLTGRLLGATILGFFIGLMIALVEALSREAQLVVRWTPTEKSTFSLGAKPVILGSSDESHIYLSEDKGYPPVTAQIYMEGGQIIMQYHEAMREKGISKLRQELKDGDRHKLGDVLIEVKTYANKSHNLLQKLAE